MKRRAIILGTLAVLLTLNWPHGTQTVSHLVHSAQRFQRYYRDFQQDEKMLNPIQRFVFSLLLANSRSPEQTTTGRTLPAGRT